MVLIPLRSPGKRKKIKSESRCLSKTITKMTEFRMKNRPQTASQKTRILIVYKNKMKS